jgi:hypothetical protein
MRRFVLVLAGTVIIAACASGPASIPARATDIDSIRGACASIGLNPSEAPFAYCVQTLRASAGPGSHDQRVSSLAGTGVADAGGFGVGVTGGKASRACAAIGLDPSTARFSYCVGNMRQTLFESGDINAR